MYLQTTLRCNMTCSHCAFNCHPNRKEHVMSQDTFANAIDLLDFQDICIGGGEPTTWKHLLWAIDYAHNSSNADYIAIITNGKKTDFIWKLLDYIEPYENVYISLSNDQFHESIDPNLFAYFKRKNMLHGVGYISPEHIVPMGRALTNRLSTSDDLSDHSCICNSAFVLPDGTIKQCGCPDAPIIGNVNSADDTAAIKELLAMDEQCIRSLRHIHKEA